MGILSSIYDLWGLVSALVIVALVVVVAMKMEKIRQQQTALDHLKKSLEEMDEQAKLIVRTDIELNKTQEELNKKITGLFALQRLSRAISTTLEETQVFDRIEDSHLEDIGFEKGLAFLYKENDKKFYLVLKIGYTQEEIEKITSSIDWDFYLELIKQGKAISSISLSDKGRVANINKLFNVRCFVAAPILPKEGNKGILFVGIESEDTVLTEGDEEIVTILANQVGQALENVKLFEQTWQAQQELEKKVEKRTQELREALREIKLVSKRKSDFVSAVSHELRTPLTSIKGYAAILLSKKLGEIPDLIRERLEKINRHSDELVHLVNGLLDISRIESGRVSMKCEPYDLNEIINVVLDLLGVQAKEKDIQLSAQVDKQLGSVMADRQQLERVLINLVGNAVKFTPKKGKIIVKAISKNDMVQVDVSDSGIGIPPEAQASIFEEFYRVDNTINEEVKGTGLGLSLVKNIIEAHKGRIWVSSKVGHGSTFSFTLPQVPK